MLVLGLAGTVAGYVLEGKGFTYQRYPELAMLLLVAALDFDAALESARAARWVSVAGCAVLCLGMAPWFARLATTFSGKNPFQEALRAELSKYGNDAALQGQVQCLDTYGGCVAALYSMGVVQSTGFLYDCYLFSGDGVEEQRYKTAFLAAYESARPRVLVMTDQFCFTQHDGFARLQRWPELERLIARDYQLRSEWRTDEKLHFWKRYEEPAEFRIYVRR
jgi:hypothetical protein